MTKSNARPRWPSDLKSACGLGISGYSARRKTRNWIGVVGGQKSVGTERGRGREKEFVVRGAVGPLDGPSVKNIRSICLVLVDPNESGSSSITHTHTLVLN